MGTVIPPPKPPQREQLWPRGEPVRTRPGTRYASAYANGCDAPLMATEALFAAACNVFDERSEYAQKKNAAGVGYVASTT